MQVILFTKKIPLIDLKTHVTLGSKCIFGLVTRMKVMRTHVTHVKLIELPMCLITHHTMNTYVGMEV
jgi:hypothetical protein